MKSTAKFMSNVDQNKISERPPSVYINSFDTTEVKTDIR